MGFYLRKKHFCPSCKTVLRRKKREVVVNSESEEAKNYDFSCVDTYLRGNIKFVTFYFECSGCGAVYEISELKKVGRRMRRVKVVSLILILIMVVCTGCGKKYLGDSLAVCGSYAVPGMFCFELKGGTYSYEVLEEDVYGRILFLYTTYHCVTDQEETAVVICQSMDQDYVYFYEDICWMIGEYTEDDIAILKEQNDWEKELNVDKMSKRKDKVTFDYWIEVEDVLDTHLLMEKCNEEIKLQESSIKSLSLVDKNAKGYELRLLTFEKDGVEDEYYILANPDYEIACMDAGDEPVDVDTLVGFKKAFGWYDE